MKRAFDLVTAAILLMVLALPMVCVGIALVLTQGLPLIFRQERMGRSGKPFNVLKFRTMRPPQPGDVAITSGDEDPRITGVGRTLRRHRMDEWPQLFNVLLGDMSLVGPRPEVPAFVDLQSDQWQEILSVRPGITGPDALAFKDEGVMLAGAQDTDRYYREKILPAKLALQQEYMRSRSFSGELGVLFRTLGALRG